MERAANFKQHRRRGHSSKPTTSVTATTPAIAPPMAVVEETNREIMVRLPNTDNAVAETLPLSLSPVEEVKEVESSVDDREVDAIINADTETVDTLRASLARANAEISQLKQVLAHSTRDGLSVVIPIPALNSTGILDVNQYEQVKALYTGVVLGMINTVHTQLASQNKKAYGLYNIDTDTKEIKMSFVITAPSPVPGPQSAEPVVSSESGEAAATTTTTVNEPDQSFGLNTESVSL